MEIFTPALIGLLGITLGWWIVHALTAKRDIANKRRERRVEAMVEVFRDLTRMRTFSNLRTLSEIGESPSRISTGIDLFGTKRQVGLFEHVANSLNTGTGKLLAVHDLIDEIRNDIRQSLSLPSIESSICGFSFNVSTASPKES